MKEYTFVLADRTYTEAYPENTVPTPVTPENYEGMSFVCWDREPSADDENTTYRAVYTDVCDVENFKKAYTARDFTWQKHNYRDMQVSITVYALVLQEHEHPLAGPVRDRAIAQIAHLTEEGSAPPFDCSVNWSHGIIAATLAMAKDTPTIWGAMSDELKKKVDTVMDAFVYSVAVGTADQNDYRTGPGFKGNYNKNWNVNYALGSIPCMVFGTYYFGEGDIELGAKRLNEKLKAFDEAEYDRMIRAFETYGWEEAKATWTTPAPKEGYADAKTMMVSGGPVYGLDFMDRTGNTLTTLGDGKGVTSGGVDYTYSNPNPVVGGPYKNIPLDRPEEIVKCMIDYNFAWKTYSTHYYKDERVAYILDGTTSPYEGMLGMMFEFGLPNRSAITYTSHDFDMIVPLMSAAKALHRYENGKKTDAPIYDCTENAERFSRVEVGMEDFIYKFRRGYQDFVSYIQGGGIDTKMYEHVNGSVGYLAAKGIWRTTLKPLGTLPIAESYEKE